MIPLLCMLIVVRCDQLSRRKGQDRAGRQEAAYPANLRLPVCLLAINLGVFDLLPPSQCLPLHNVLYYVAPRRRHSTACSAKLLTYRLGLFCTSLWWVMTQEVLQYLVWQEEQGKEKSFWNFWPTLFLFVCYLFCFWQEQNIMLPVGKCLFVWLGCCLWVSAWR